MKKFLVILFSAFVVFQSCKTKGTGTLEITLEVERAHASQDEMDKMKTILTQRLIKFGIDEEDISFTTKENRLIFDLKEESNYKKFDRSMIRRLLMSSADLQFWETYSLSDVGTAINKFLDDSAGLEAWKRIQPVFQLGVSGNTYPNSCEMGTCNLRDTTAVSYFFDSLRQIGIFPADLKFGWNETYAQDGQPISHLIMMKKTGTGGASMDFPTIEDVETTSAGDGSVSPVISGKMTGSFKDQWARLTKANIGKQIAITLDGIVMTYPTVQSEIPEGGFSITGSFTVDEANELVSVLSAEHLPGRIYIVEEDLLP
ncbi:MAG TPA: hypothetical protein VL651_04425 [Bacteroidia bacterium]|jgi:preprotein translocase subunit SecD|nr:hypothetical protein [Bacteroidia bacterium]